MNWKFWKKREFGNPMDILDETARSHPGNGRYTNEDRYQDFRQLFLGSEQGKRVLHEIMAFGHIFYSSVPNKNEPDHNVWVSEGERRIALKILTAINAEPKSRPDTTTHKEK